jgi:hypothetical protein
MFGAGIVRTFTEYDRVINLEDEEIRYGLPQIRVIDDADYIGDVAAKTREDFIIEGDVYKLPTDYARDLFHEHADDIMSDCKLQSDYHPDKISSGEWDINRLSLREYTTFMDLYIYDEGITVTIMPDGKASKILRTVEEDGPEGSPYDFLGYKYFPGSTYPIPPAWNWHDLDVTMNILARTAKEQAESQKDVFFVPPENEDIGKKARNAKNMDIIEAQNPQDMQHVSLGGVNPQNYEWMGFAESMFSKTGPNADVMGGRGAQAPTLGQEQMIFANASRIVNNMYTRWHRFMTSVIRKLAWKVWTDPTVYVPVIREIPGVGELPTVFSQAEKVGDYYDFVFKLEPYSSQRKNPEIHAQQMMMFLTQWVLRTMEFASQQGAQLDIPLATRIMAEKMGFDNFNQFYKTAEPHELQQITYQMQPDGNRRPNGADRASKPQGKSGVQNDTFGASEPSRTANSQRQSQQVSKKGATQ